jgi:DedD protein
MSLELSEQAKYRLTGGLIFMLLIVVGLPGLMKKSNQRFEENLSLHLKVPPKPKAPVLKIPTAQQVFNKVKDVEPATPQIVERDIKINFAKAEPLAIEVSSKPEPKPEPVKVEANISAKKPTNIAKTLYALQLASFTKPTNAEYLVKRLQKKGYAASFDEVNGKNGKLYKVWVTKLNGRDEAVATQKKIASNMQLHGFLIKQG